MSIKILRVGMTKFLNLLILLQIRGSRLIWDKEYLVKIYPIEKRIIFDFKTLFI